MQNKTNNQFMKRQHLWSVDNYTVSGHLH